MSESTHSSSQVVRTALAKWVPQNDYPKTLVALCNLEEQLESLERGLRDCVTFIHDYPLGVEDKDYDRRRALILAAGSRFASGSEVASSPAASDPATKPWPGATAFYRPVSNQESKP